MQTVTVTFKLASFCVTDLLVLKRCLQHGNCRRSFEIFCPCLILLVSLYTLQNRHIEIIEIQPLGFSELISEVNWVVVSRQLCQKTTSGRGVTAEEKWVALGCLETSLVGLALTARS